jgi:serine/threonine-protein kinase
MRVRSGTRLGPYEITSLIGAGAMGEVHRARDTRLDREVAIKVLSPTIAEDQTSLARFVIEARAIAKLSHPNILAIFDVELEQRPLFLVTELLEGETLRQSLRDSPLPWRRAVEITIGLSDGLAAAHLQEIIHRDLKPENIFVTKQGIPKILDFGLAQFKPELRAGDDVATVLARSESGLLMGTLGYLAPEQARGERVTAAADVFSLGCVFYEMITGRRAFSGSTPASTLAAILNADPPNLQGFPEDVPRELNLWITRCLEKEPATRVQSAHDLSLILRDLVGTPSVERSVGRSAPMEVRSLAVLPFVISTSSPDAEYLADGVTESLINNLAQLSHLRVVARSTVFRHRGKDIDPLQVGSSLGVDAVLSGRIFQRGDTLVIGTELVDVRDGLQLWGQQYKRQLTDIFTIEDEISTEISGRLRMRLTPEEHSRLTKRYTENPEAYRFYLKGRHCWNKRTLAAMKEAVGHFEQAVEADPAYARAHTGLADCQSMVAIYGGVDPRQSYTRSKAANERALQIDPTLGEAHASRGFRLLHFDWQFREAESAFRQAIELNPGYASGHQWLGFVLGLTRRFEEARAELTIAQQLDPFSASINTSAIWPLYWARQFDAAVAGFRTAVELHPGYWVAHYYLGLALAQKGEYGQALPILRYAVEIGDSSWPLQGLGFVCGRAGETSQAREVLARLHELRRHQYIPPTHLAATYAGLNEPEEVLQHLQSAVRELDWQVAWLHVHPFWDGVRQDRRFRELLRQVDLPGAE